MRVVPPVTVSESGAFTRSTIASYFDSTGARQSAAVNELRFNNHEDTGDLNAPILEVARTNSIRNNTMVGAVAGTPGTRPTNWAAGSDAGLVRTIVGTGTENGITYIEIRWLGTATSTSIVFPFESTTQVAAVNGQTWTASFYQKLVGGSASNVTAFTCRIRFNDSGGSSLGITSTALTPTSANLRTQRNVEIETATDAATAYIQPQFQATVTNGAAIDFTIRIGLPQLELGAYVTTPILTSAAAVLRAADVNTLTLYSTETEPQAGSPSTESIYSAGATYALGAEVISTVYHRKYESLQAANTGNPLPIYPETETAWWLDIGPTNKWAMFDLYRNTETIGTSPLRVMISPGVRIDSVGLLMVEGTSVTISLDSATAPLENYYSHTEDLSDRAVGDWYDYFYEPFTTKTEVVRFDIPPYNPAILTITVTNTGGNASVGGVVLGTAQYLGEAQRDADFQLVQFSVIERDEFGNATLVPRRSIPTTEQRLIVDAGSVEGVAELLRELDAVPALWSAAEDTDHVLCKPLTILGIYRNARFKLAEPESELLLKLEEI